MKCPGKTLQTVVGGMFLPVVGRNGATVRVVQAKLGERNVVKGRGLGELVAGYRMCAVVGCVAGHRVHLPGLSRAH